MDQTGSDQPLWRPDAERIAAANITVFRTRAAAEWKFVLPDYAALWHWSVERRDQFWLQLWRETKVVGDGPGKVILKNSDRMRGARFFPEARLNYAENSCSSCLRSLRVFVGEEGMPSEQTRPTARAAAPREGLLNAYCTVGIGAPTDGDRVGCGPQVGYP